MFNINRYNWSYKNSKVNLLSQLIPFFNLQLVNTIVDGGGWADFFGSPENKEKISKQLLDANIVWLTQKWDAIIEISPEDNLPELKNEIYRLIEKSFSLVWWNTGKWIKTDHYNDENFKQLIVVRNTASDNLFLSWYRYSLVASAIDSENKLNTPMWTFFDFDKEALEKLVDGNAIELWTAWVNKDAGRVSIYGLHGIRDGLVHLNDKYKNKYFIWKMTIPSEESPESYSTKSKDFSIGYLNKFYSLWSFHQQVKPKSDFVYSYQDFDSIIKDMNWNYSVDEKNLKEILKEIDPKNINWLFPNMFPIYLDRIKKLDYVGTVKNWNVCESGIIVDCDEIKEEVVNSRKKGIEDWKSKFGNSKIKYWDYLAMSKSL